MPLESYSQGVFLTIDVEVRQRVVKAQVWLVRVGWVNLLDGYEPGR